MESTQQRAANTAGKGPGLFTAEDLASGPRQAPCPGTGPPPVENRRSPAPNRGQAAVQGRSLSGLRTAQMRLTRSPVTSKASTVTTTPSC